MGENTSEVARFREEQALRDQSAQWGLYGPAVVANHASNTARLQQGAERILGFFREGKHEEAEALMSTDYWNVEGQSGQALCSEQHEEGGGEEWHA